MAAAQIRSAARGAARAAAARAPARPTVEQVRLATRLSELFYVRDWQGIVALEQEALALARGLRGTDPGYAGTIYSWLGNGFLNVGEYSRAREMHEQSKAILEEMGDRLGMAQACGNLGNCCDAMGDYVTGIEMHENSKAIYEELGDRVGLAKSCGGLGLCYGNMGDFVQARKMHEQVRAMGEEMGDRALVTLACGNLGTCCQNMGDYAMAREMHEQARGMAEALGDCAGAARAWGNLGNCYQRTGDYALACEMHEQHRTISEALGHRAAVAGACGALGECMSSTGEYMKAISYFETQYTIIEELGNIKDLPTVALNMGVAIRLHVLADRQAAAAGQALRPAAGASQLEVGAAVEIHSLQKSPELNGVRGKVVTSHDVGTGRCGVKTATGRDLALKPINLKLIGALTGPDAGASRVPDPRSSASVRLERLEDRVEEAKIWLRLGLSASARLEDRVNEAKAWLLTALTGRRVAELHLAHLAYDAGDEDTALAHLKGYLSWYLTRGRN